MIEYRIEKDLALKALQDLWMAAAFTEGMPESQWFELDRMIRNSTFTVAAYDGSDLVGLVRILTDYMDLCQIADILVAETHQHQGIGSELVRRAYAELDAGTQVFVHAADDARPFYKKLGFTRMDDILTMSIGANQSNH